MISKHLMTRALHNINIKINNFSVTQIQQVKSGGIKIYNKLQWKLRVYDICTKLFKLSSVLYKIKHCLTSTCLKPLYLSLAHQYLLYCSGIWGEHIKHTSLCCSQHRRNYCAQSFLNLNMTTQTH